MREDARRCFFHLSGIAFLFLDYFLYFCARKQTLGLSLALRCERKVRAAQGAPHPKIDAIGDGRLRQKKTTAFRKEGKGEKVV